jgi:sulfatase modifying factor 1
MKKSLGIVLILVITIIGGTLLSVWYYQQKDITRVLSIEEDRPHKQTENINLAFSKISKDKTLMVLIPEGNFYMGNPEGDDAHYDENPSHKVHLDAFWIDCYEITNRLYKIFVDDTGHRIPYVDTDWAKPYNWENGSYPPGKADYPVVLVSWEDTTSYAKWAGKRLPTEAEWEKAARGGLLKKRYPWGDKIDELHANYFTSITNKNEIKPVGTMLPNPYGIYDIAGNVWEWCTDWYGKTYYRTSLYKNPQGPEKGRYRVFRGGAWINRDESLRCSERARNVPTHRSYIIGFRCAKSVNLKEIVDYSVKTSATAEGF